MGKAFGIGRFWPDGVNVHGVWLDHSPADLSYGGLVKARNDRLKRVSADGLESLLAIASDMAGREVQVTEILIEGKKK